MSSNFSSLKPPEPGDESLFQVLIVGIQILFYAPFFRVMDKRAQDDEAAESDHAPDADDSSSGATSVGAQA